MKKLCTELFIAFQRLVPQHILSRGGSILAETKTVLLKNFLIKLFIKVYKINLNEAYVDTDSALVDGKFKPSVAGWYQVNASVADKCSPRSFQTIAWLYKNGTSVTQGTNLYLIWEP